MPSAACGVPPGERARGKRVGGELVEKEPTWEWCFHVQSLKDTCLTFLPHSL
jgi:hypothetical protein